MIQCQANRTSSMSPPIFKHWARLSPDLIHRKPSIKAFEPELELVPHEAHTALKTNPKDASSSKSWDTLFKNVTKIWRSDKNNHFGKNGFWSNLKKKGKKFYFKVFSRNENWQNLKKKATSAKSRVFPEMKRRPIRKKPLELKIEEESLKMQPAEISFNLFA